MSGPAPLLRKSALPHPCARRGAVYILVMMVAALVAALGVAAVGSARLGLKSSDATARAGSARLLALSGLEQARWFIDQTVAIEASGGASWRSSFTSGAWVSDRTMGEGTFTWRLVDEDGDLEDDPSEAFTIEAIGTIGENRHLMSVRMTPGESDEPISALNAAVTVGGNIRVEDDVWRSGYTMHANGNFTADNEVVHPRATASGNIYGSIFYGGAASNQTALTMPDPSSVFDFYIAHGTDIPRTSLPTSGGARAIKDRVLSPSSNPFGSTNSLGIYIIDLENVDKISIEDSRIVGTLVLLNSADGSEVVETVTWEPAVSNYPALMVKGNFELRFSSDSTLSEGLTKNYNPPGTPYRGISDILPLGSFPSVLCGLVYVSGNLTIENNDCYTEGRFIVGGDLLVDDDWYHYALALWRNEPPPGFRTMTGPPVMVPGSFTQQVE
ncbi:MAG: hypothetical protein RLN76_11685 [Phycisphaeraceae bacterium]